MRILLLSQFWTPEPILKGIPFAKELVRRGHEVEVLTGFPNYPGGKIYPGYRLALFRRETLDGIRVNRVWLYPSHDTSGKRRVLNYLSFALSACLIAPFVTRRADVIYVYHPPATVGLPARWLSALKKAPVVYDVQDLWPDTVAASGMLPARLAQGLARYCDWVYRKVDRIAALSPGFKRTLVERGIDPEKIDVIPNWCDEDALRPPEEVPTDGPFTVLFAGTMGYAQALDPVLDAAALLHGRNVDVRFRFVGGGMERDRLAARAESIPNVEFLPRRPMDEMPALVASADALLVHLRDDPLFAITVPSKIQSYLYAGKPILMGVRGDAADIVGKAEAGVLFEPEDAESLAAAVASLMAMAPEARQAMGMRGATYYAERLALVHGATSFEKAFERAIEDHRIA